MSEYRFTVETLPTPTGTMTLVTDEAGRVRAADWDEHRERREQLMQRYYGDGVQLIAAAGPTLARVALESYFEGDLAALDAVQTETRGTPFQRAVWAALREIPPGETMSYGALAAKIGKPKAVRAVGLANGANPIAIIVPCHRVIGADRTLTGYGGGLARKRWLIDHESGRGKGQAALPLAQPAGCGPI